ncbi:MAG: monovalent cation/H(+) antiporter subunit G [Deltaproteobacteria bacterium]|nr:monovalent cation/H(+) antiporter subunit G [Deltaproteobacteria bacterium]
MLLELLAALAMLAGTFFMVVTGIGLVRFPDVYTRIHAAGKAGTVGVGLLIVAPMVYFGPTEPFVALRGFLAIVFQLLTTPGATYLLAHACYVTSYPAHARTEVDELQDWIPVYPDEEFGHE